jgi:hypothetical protein
MGRYLYFEVSINAPGKEFYTIEAVHSLKCLQLFIKFVYYQIILFAHDQKLAAQK